MSVRSGRAGQRQAPQLRTKRAENRRKRGTRSCAHTDSPKDSRTRPVGRAGHYASNALDGSNVRPFRAGFSASGAPHVCGVRYRPTVRAQTRSVLVLVLLLEPGHDGRIGQRRRVTKRLPLGDITQQPPHDFSRSRLRQVRREDHVVGPRDGADLLHDVVLELGDQALASLCAVAQASRTRPPPAP